MERSVRIHTAQMKNIWDAQMNLNPEETTTDQTALFAAG